jgi:hypothetical protein
MSPRLDSRWGGFPLSGAGFSPAENTKLCLALRRSVPSPKPPPSSPLGRLCKESRAGEASCHPPSVSTHAVLLPLDTSFRGVCPPVHPAIALARTPQCLQNLGHPPPGRRDLRDNIGRHIPRYPCDTPAYNLQDEYQLDTVDANLLLGFAADLRDYGVAAQILKMLDVHQIDLITNNPQKVRDLRTHGIEVVSVIPSEVTVTEDNARYLQTKRDRLGHLFRDTGPGRVDRRIKRS